MRVSVADFWGLTLIQEHSSAPLSRGQEVRLGPLPLAQLLEGCQILVEVLH